MAVLDGLASEKHYVRHLAPIWKALPPDVRGTFYCASHDALHAAHAHELPALHPKLVRDARRPARQWVMVAAYNDLVRCKGRPTVFVEHGAGQTYAGEPSMVRSPWYPGGADRDQVRLFVCPGEHVADANRAHYPDADYAVVGCPALDELYIQRRDAVDGDRPFTVAVSFHARLKTAGGGSCPEFGWSWPHFAAPIAELVHTVPQWRWLGHAHPRAWPLLHRWWSEIGAEPCADYAKAAREADVYVCDNSSTMYEMAALGVPVVVLNSPDYRRDVHHGLRFWEYADIGPNVDEPADLHQAICDATTTPDRWQARRAAAARHVYATPPPHATQAAADAITRCLNV